MRRLSQASLDFQLQIQSLEAASALSVHLFGNRSLFPIVDQGIDTSLNQSRHVELQRCSAIALAV